MVRIKFQNVEAIRKLPPCIRGRELVGKTKLMGLTELLVFLSEVVQECFLHQPFGRSLLLLHASSVVRELA